jgi:8-oxo-dGTP pyrophosphatase MutT (NUDIX family)
MTESGLGALAAAVERIPLSYGADPSELAAMLRGGREGRAGQLAAIAWVLDSTNTQILLVDHRTFGWSCPGGHVEVGELPVETAIRELAEETGLLLSPAGADPVTLTLDHVPGDACGPAHLHWVLGYRFVGDPSTPVRVERDAVAWHPVDDLPDRAVADLAPLLAGLVRGR